MKMTADQLLKIAGITPTTTLRARLNESTGLRTRRSVKESANPDITRIDYTYQIRYNGADAAVFHPNGEESLVSHDNTMADQLEYGEVSTLMTQSDYDKIQKVLDFLVDEGFKDFNGEEEEYEGDVDVLLDNAHEEHKRLFGPGVKARFLVGEDS